MATLHEHFWAIFCCWIRCLAIFDTFEFQRFNGIIRPIFSLCDYRKIHLVLKFEEIKSVSWKATRNIQHSNIYSRLFSNMRIVKFPCFYDWYVKIFQISLGYLTDTPICGVSAPLKFSLALYWEQGIIKNKTKTPLLKN